MREKNEIKDKLLEIVNPDDTIYTILRHVSKSGLYRVISLYIIKENEPLCIDYLAAYLLEGYDTRHLGCKAKGAGMDMGFYLVNNLSYILFGDGYKLNQKWL